MVLSFSRVRAIVLPLALVAVAIVFAGTGLWAIHESGFRYPAFDQYRLYIDYLGRPFPDNLLQLENGHRPIVPALLRVLEIHCFGASQGLQLLVGALLALTAALIPAFSAWRERGWSAVARLTVAALAAMAIFWLANARMLLHGNESVHAYLVVTMVAVAGWCGARAETGRVSGWLWMGAFAATVATFSFGPGIATFPALLLILAVRRARPRVLMVPAVALATCLWAYVFLLPGDAGVRGNLHLAPLDNLEVALRWLASPWVHAWLGFAEPPLMPWVLDATAGRWLHAPLRETAAVLAPAGALATRTPLVIGALGGVMLGIAWLDALRDATPVSRTAWIGLAWATFAAATALLIGLSRLAYFALHPGQIFAERYLVWPCLFWAGLAIYLLARLESAGLRKAVGMIATAALALALVLWPTHRAWNGWAGAVERIVARAAPAARLGVIDPEVFPDDDSARRHHVEATLALMAGTETGYFGPQRSGERVEPVAVPATAALRVASSWEDAVSGARTLRIAGELAAPLQRFAELRLVDAAGDVQGLLRPTHRNGSESLGDRLRGARAGLDGHLHALPPGSELRLLIATAAGPRELGRYRLDESDGLLALTSP